MHAGRFAPSPSGDLHVGNLRTALLAWLFARSTGRQFLIRIEDLDRVKLGAADRQLADLRALGLDWDFPPVRQTERTTMYDAAIGVLTEAGLTYNCYCTRREILQAASAPHAPAGAYPGTCRNLTVPPPGRPPALRLRSAVGLYTVDDVLKGPYTGVVDDFVLRRADGVAAYNLAVVVDDGDQGVDQVVRGDDLLASSPRQAYLASLLRIARPTYAHVPLALNPAGARLAKRDGAVTLADLRLPPSEVIAMLAGSLGLSGRTPAELLSRWDPSNLPTEPWIFDAKNR